MSESEKKALDEIYANEPEPEMSEEDVEGMYRDFQVYMKYIELDTDNQSKGYGEAKSFNRRLY
jgi:hypothetical protein